MCFSAEADFAAAAVITVPAVDALRHVKERRELPIALIPAVFAAHSLMSGFAWLWFDGKVSAGVGDTAAWFYALVAFAVLPVLVPWAIFAIEDVPWRRNLIAVIAIVGSVTGVVFLWRLVANGYVAVPHDDWVHWAVQGHGSIVLTFGYLVGTCGAMLFSGERWLMVYGFLNVIAVALVALATREGFASLWCLWAALTSGFVALFLRQRGGSLQSVSGTIART